jgi:hypothetical protein
MNEHQVWYFAHRPEWVEVVFTRGAMMYYSTSNIERMVDPDTEPLLWLSIKWLWRHNNTAEHFHLLYSPERVMVMSEVDTHYHHPQLGRVHEWCGVPGPMSPDHVLSPLLGEILSKVDLATIVRRK